MGKSVLEAQPNGRPLMVRFCQLGMSPLSTESMRMN
jgi:hypothetical protein